MTDPALLNSLSKAFVAGYRSFGQYLAWADPRFNQGEAALRLLIQTETEIVGRLGNLLFNEQGRLDTGDFPIVYGDLHFQNTSSLLPRWLKANQELLQELTNVKASLGSARHPGVTLVDELIAHETDAIAQIQALIASAK